MVLSIPAQKSELRARFGSRKITSESANALLKILEHILVGQVGVWGCFSALLNEVSLEPIYQKIKTIQWAFPKADGEKLSYFIPGAKGFKRGNLGVLEPDPEGAQRIEIADLDGVLIPGLAFDLEGTRLGRGKGYFDKNFKQFNKQTYGIAVHDQIVQRLPREDFDLRVKHLVTDRGILHF